MVYTMEVKYVFHGLHHKRGFRYFCGVHFKLAYLGFELKLDLRLDKWVLLQGQYVTNVENTTEKIKISKMFIQIKGFKGSFKLLRSNLYPARSF